MVFKRNGQVPAAAENADRQVSQRDVFVVIH
jgi:hypothetical protein